MMAFSQLRLFSYRDILLLPIRVFLWWYSGGVKDVVRFILYHIQYIENLLYFREMLIELLKLSPLHKDLGRNFLDQLTARFIGVVVRGGWVLGGGFLLLAGCAAGLMVIFLWLIFPLILCFECIVSFLVVFGFHDAKLFHETLIHSLEDFLYSFF